MIDREERSRQQYASDSNLNTRIDLHRRFSVNPVNWYHWVFDQMQLEENNRIVELGAGTGLLWAENRKRLPRGARLLLTDPSPGMLASAKQQLAGISNVEFREMTATRITEPDQSADAVVANHMLYEVADRPAAFAEIVRILKPDGHFFAATNGARHMAELDALIGSPERTCEIGRGTFSLENGATQLAPYFGSVACVRQPNSLAVTDTSAAIAYVKSLSLQLPDGELDRIRLAIETTIATEGAFRIQRDAGLFICAEPILR